MFWFSQFHHEVDTLKSILNKNSYPRDFGKRTDFFFFFFHKMLAPETIASTVPKTPNFRKKTKSQNVWTLVNKFLHLQWKDIKPMAILPLKILFCPEDFFILATTNNDFKGSLKYLNGESTNNRGHRLLNKA